jgi:hypothetical protein
VQVDALLAKVEASQSEDFSVLSHQRYGHSLTTISLTLVRQCQAKQKNSSTVNRSTSGSLMKIEEQQQSSRAARRGWARRPRGRWR